MHEKPPKNRQLHYHGSSIETDTCIPWKNYPSPAFQNSFFFRPFLKLRKISLKFTCTHVIFLNVYLRYRLTAHQYFYFGWPETWGIRRLVSWWCKPKKSQQFNIPHVTRDSLSIVCGAEEGCFQVKLQQSPLQSVLGSSRNASFPSEP